MQSIRIQTFAALKDHLGAEFEFETSEGVSAAEIIAALETRVPAAGELLAASRLAIGDEIVAPEYVLTADDLRRGEFFVLPPASGG